MITSNMVTTTPRYDFTVFNRQRVNYQVVDVLWLLETGDLEQQTVDGYFPMLLVKTHTGPRIQIHWRAIKWKFLQGWSSICVHARRAIKRRLMRTPYISALHWLGPSESCAQVVTSRISPAFSIPVFSGDPAQKCMYERLFCNYYWTQIAAVVNKLLCNSSKCCKSPVRYGHQRHLKLCFARGLSILLQWTYWDLSQRR